MRNVIRRVARWAYYLLFGRSGVDRVVNGRSYRFSARIARGIPPSISAGGLPVWLSQLPRARIAVDIGANVGIWSIMGAVEMSPGSIIYAFEPSPTTFSLLADGARIARGPGRIIPVQAAVGETEGQAGLKVAGDHTLNHLTASSDQADLMVPIVSLDRFSQQHGMPDVVKIDVEGWELFVLRGMRGLLYEADPVVIVELHWRPALGVTPDGIQRFVQSVGYAMYDVYGTPITSAEALARHNVTVLRKAS